MAKIFEKLMMRKPRYSAFDRSHDRKMTFEMGQLIPCLVEEVYPGDYYQIATEVMVRMPALIRPVYHRINVYCHYFFVPNRIVWNEWENFITGGKDGDLAPTLPQLNAPNSVAGESSLADYLGYGSDGGAGTNYVPQLNQLPFRAYTSIYNEYFRDETLQDELDLTSQGDIREVRMRCWEKDYFTSALPWTQRGQNLQTPFSFNWTEADDVYDSAGNLVTTSENIQHSSAGKLQVENGTETGGIDNTANLGMTINDLRNTARLQEFLENNARGGFRYIEQLLHRWGLRSQDQRLQRPEYLGGGRQPVTISEVLNTSATATQPQGDFAGHGISVGTNNYAKKKVPEHGYIIGIMSVLPRTGYFQGVPKHFLYNDRLDYYHPEFAHIGEQPIQNQELYCDKDDSGTWNTDTFGYQQAWAHLKYAQSTVHGEFRSSQDNWHLDRKFAAQPSLNGDFVESDPDTRIFAVPSQPKLEAYVHNSVKARRPMPYFANPKL